jgi:hypothetical protein
MCQSISINNTSVASRPISRSLTERNLQIQVHQYYGYRLHLVWRNNKHDVSTERFWEVLSLRCTKSNNSALNYKEAHWKNCTCVCEGDLAVHGWRRKGRDMFEENPVISWIERECWQSSQWMEGMFYLVMVTFTARARYLKTMSLLPYSIIINDWMALD